MQFLQVLYTGDLFHGIGVAEDEVAEAEVVGYDAAQVDVHFLGILVDEGGTVLGGVGHVFRFGRLDDEWHKRVLLAYGGTEAYAGHAVFFATFGTRKADVSHHTENIILIFIIDGNGFFIISGQYDFGTSTHTQGTLVGVQCFSTELLALLQHKLVEVGQQGGIKPDAVFYQ